MGTLVTAWRFLLLAGVFVFPQLLGVLLYYRLSRAPRWLAFIAAGLLPAVVFFWLALLHLTASLRETYAHDGGCGMPAMAAAFMVIAGTTMQLGGGLFTQMVLLSRRRRKVAALKGGQ